MCSIGTVIWRLYSGLMHLTSSLLPRPRLSQTEAEIAQLKLIGTSVMWITDCTCDDDVTGVDMIKNRFQTYCNSLRLATALLCRMDRLWEPLPLSKEQCPSICLVEYTVLFPFRLVSQSLQLSRCGHTNPSRLWMKTDPHSQAYAAACGADLNPHSTTPPALLMTLPASPQTYRVR